MRLVTTPARKATWNKSRDERREIAARKRAIKGLRRKKATT